MLTLATTPEIQLSGLCLPLPGCVFQQQWTLMLYAQVQGAAPRCRAVVMPGSKSNGVTVPDTLCQLTRGGGADSVSFISALFHYSSC